MQGTLETQRLQSFGDQHTGSIAFFFFLFLHAGLKIHALSHRHAPMSLISKVKAGDIVQQISNTKIPYKS